MLTERREKHGLGINAIKLDILLWILITLETINQFKQPFKNVLKFTENVAGAQTHNSPHQLHLMLIEAWA